MKIRVTDAMKIQATLDACNGRAKDHTYRDAREIVELATLADDQRTALGLSLREARGMRVVYCSGDAVAKSYRYSRRATEVELTLFSTGWFLTACNPATIWKTGGGDLYRTLLTPEADAAAVAKFRARYVTAARTAPSRPGIVSFSDNPPVQPDDDVDAIRQRVAATRATFTAEEANK